MSPCSGLERLVQLHHSTPASRTVPFEVRKNRTFSSYNEQGPLWSHKARYRYLPVSFLNSQHCSLVNILSSSVEARRRSSKRALFRDRKSHVMRGGSRLFLLVQLPQDSVAVPPRFLSTKNRIHVEIQNI